LRLSNWGESEPINKNANGFTLVGVLMVLVVLSVLGVSVLMITSNFVKLSTGERDDQSVFYIAEAGATIVMSEIEEKVKTHSSSSAITTANAFFAKLEAEILSRKKPSSEMLEPRVIDSFEMNLGKKPLAEVTVEPVDPMNGSAFREYKIFSTGEIGNQNRTRTVVGYIQISYIEGGGISIPPNVGVYADNIKLENGTINGDLILGSATGKGIEISGWPTINGKIIIPDGANNNIITGPPEWIKQKAPPVVKTNMDYKFSLPPFPDFPEYPMMLNSKVDKDGNLNIGTAQTLSLDANYQFKNISFTSDATLTLDVGSKDISIVANRIAGGGHLNIKGTGRLTIYLRDNINLSGHVNKDKKDNLLIYIGPSQNPDNPKTLISSDYGQFNASIYAKDANIEFRGSAKLEGHLITGGQKVKFPGATSGKSSGTVAYAPNANVELTGSGSLEGTVISKYFNLSGGGKVDSKPVNLDDHPFFSGSGGPGKAKFKKVLLKEKSN